MAAYDDPDPINMLRSADQQLYLSREVNADHSSTCFGHPRRKLGSQTWILAWKR